MYRKTIATAVAGLLILGLGACGNASDAKTADAGSTSQSQTTKKPAEKKPVEQPADLTGTWKQTNSGSTDSWMEAEITADTITVQWVSDNGDTKSLYWKGSYNAPDKAGDWKWTSQGDTAAMQASLLGSQDATKDFTYTKADGVSWETVGTYSTRNIYLHDLNLRCRYLRYVSQSEQDYWLSLAHFAVNEELTCDSVAVTAPGRAQHEAFRLLDGSFTTSYRATVKAGDTIAVDCSGISVSEITLLASSLPAARLSLVSGAATVELGALSEPFSRISPETPTEAEKLLLTFTEDGLADIQEIFFS